MSSSPMIIESNSMSMAWTEAFMALWKTPELYSLTVSVYIEDETQSIENSSIRALLDTTLVASGLNSCHTVANTIFPASLWNSRRPADYLFKRYLRVHPLLTRVDRRNRNGMYFHRMIAYGEQRINQLDHVIATWKRGNHRRSALQVAIFDPARDLTHQRQRGFPCLQHVLLAHDHVGGLAITGVYATQEIAEKAYGNYLGLHNLGRFMAQEMGLRLTRMTCFASLAKRNGSRLRKRDLESLHMNLQAAHRSAGGTAHLVKGGSGSGR